MAVQEQTPYIEYIANGVTTNFPLEFYCEQKEHLIVSIGNREVLLSEFSLVNGDVVFISPPKDQEKISIERNTPFTREITYATYDNSLRPKVINRDFDKIWWKLQELGLKEALLRKYVDSKTDELKAFLLEEIRKQGLALDQLEEYYNYLMQKLAEIAISKGWDASLVFDGDKTQKQINDAQKDFNDEITENTSYLIENIESLRNLNATKYKSAFVGGYYSKGDGGGGSFYYDPLDDTSYDNGGTIIVSANGARWKRYINQYIDIRWFGAKGDGITVNPESTIQKAIDISRELKVKTYIPTGVFLVNRRLLIGSNTYIFGDGELSEIKAVDNFPNSVEPWITYHLFYNNGVDKDVPDKNINLENFCVNGNREGQPLDMPNNAPLVYIVAKDGGEPMQNIFIDKLFVKTSWQSLINGCMGVLIENVNRCRISRCHAYKTGRDGFSVAGKSSNIVMAKNHVEYCGDDGLSVNSFAFNQSDPNVRIKNVVIFGNTIEKAGSRGILASNAEGTVISNNVIDGTTAWGIAVEGFMFSSNSDIVITGNRINNASKYLGDINSNEYNQCGGIIVRGSAEETRPTSRIKVVNNIVSSPAKAGVYIRNESEYQMTQVDVDNNTIYFPGDSGVSVDHVGNGSIEQINITSNTIRQPKKEGIKVSSGYFVGISQNKIFNVGEGNDQPVDGISVSNVTEISILGNYCLDSRGPNSKQAYGISMTNNTNGIVDSNASINSVSGGIYQINNPGVTFGTNKP